MPLQNLTPLQQLRAGRLPLRLGTLMLGLSLYGGSLALILRGGLGLDPWDVFHYGVALHLPLTIGTIVVLTSLVVLLAWIPLKQWPGLGTIANALWVGISMDVVLALVPNPDALWLRIMFMVGGIVINGFATALYIGAQLGPGPRDGLMTGLARRTGLSIRLVRTGLEVTVLIVGILLGGIFGIGTVLYALGIGPLTQFFLRFTVIRLDEDRFIKDS